jgi:hypothetical protein
MVAAVAAVAECLMVLDQDLLVDLVVVVEQIDLVRQLVVHHHIHLHKDILVV